ncbi:MAG: CRISPR-associated CARF protein Csa3 [Candidatus Methanomethyliaceae archaeon]|nr:CRISPR-associated CARF protein Csa3 [Candidatus Methanomethyliaceae archaeon]
MPYLIAVLGFDERHVIKSLLRLGFKNVKKVYLIVPSARTTKQSEDAVKRIREVAELAGVSVVEVFDVDPLNFEESVNRIRRLLMSLCAGGEEITISLGGGMRALVIEALIAALLIPRELSSGVKVVSDLETGEGFVEIRIADLLMISELKFDELLILSYLLKKNVVGPTEINRDLNIPKTTAWKILSKLSNKGLLIKYGREYKLSGTGNRVASIANELIKKL